MRLTRTFGEGDFNGICVPMQVSADDLDAVIAGLAVSRNVDGILVTADPTPAIWCNATPMGTEDGDPLPGDIALLTTSMFVGDGSVGDGHHPVPQSGGVRWMQDGQWWTDYRSCTGCYCLLHAGNA